MALGFILGGAEIDHEQAILEQLLAWQKQAPSENYFVIVPDHIKFETEVKVLEFLRQHYSSAKGLYAQTKTQVFSFSRLAWYFIKDQRKCSRTTSESNGTYHAGPKHFKSAGQPTCFCG